MSQIAGILEKLEGTSVCETLVQIEEAYERIAREQRVWYETTQFLCPDGCGQCCKGFEPDLFQAEALYMSAWLIENQNDIALQIADGAFPFDNGEKTCPLFNPDSPYHCSIYNGRAFICRLFGASSFRSRTGEKMWRPCKFYPGEVLSAHNPPLEKRQYNEAETEKAIGAVPPLMSDFTEGIASDSGETELLRNVLPSTIRHLLWLIEMNDNGNDNPNGSPSGAPPMAA